MLNRRKLLMSKTSFILFLIFFIYSSSLFSQSKEFGVFLGTTTYKGELNKSLFTLRLIKPSVGLLYRKNINNHWAHRFGLNYGRVEADDALSDDEYQKRRNLSFRSSIWDLHYYLEFNFLPYQIANMNTRFTPFIFAGVNGYLFNPKGYLNGSWYSLQPLGTEGQGTSFYSGRKKYNRLQFAIPFGGGVKFRVARRVGMTIEAGARKLYTDYLDDVSTTYADKVILQANYGEISVLLSDRSIDGQAPGNENRQRGNASDNDWYMFTGFTINYTISKKYNDNCTPFKGKLR
jgi:hypothetical protein